MANRVAANNIMRIFFLYSDKLSLQEGYYFPGISHYT